MLNERELKGNDIDTFVVRLLQAQKKGGPTTAEVGTIAEPEAPQEKPQTRKEKKAAAQAESEPDQEVAREKEDSGDAIVPEAWKDDLFNLLKKIRKGTELDDKDKETARKLYDQIN